MFRLRWWLNMKVATWPRGGVGLYTIADLLELALGFAFMLHTDGTTGCGEVGRHDGSDWEDELSVWTKQRVV